MENGNHGVDQDAAMEELKKLQESNSELVITEGELEECGTVPTAEGDVPRKKKEEDDDE
jgi:hypothetical protein